MTAVATPPRTAPPRPTVAALVELRRRARRSRKLDPRVQIRNPVMFVVEIGAVITTIATVAGGEDPRWFSATIAIWLWLTVIFANLAEALAEGRGKAQAATLRNMRSETVAHLRGRLRARGLRAAQGRRRARRRRRGHPR